MTTFQLLWTLAGFIIGWVGIDMVAVVFRAKVPYAFNIGIGFVGALIAFTLVK